MEQTKTTCLEVCVDSFASAMAALEGGVWELFLPGLQQYDNYKYAVHTRWSFAPAYWWED